MIGVRRIATCLGLALTVLLAEPPAAGCSGPSIILATATSAQDSGLLDVLVPRFEKESGIGVTVVAVFSGAAQRITATGAADSVLVHAPQAERKYVDAGHLVGGRAVMHNDFVIVGPTNDPAGVRAVDAVVAAVKAIAGRR
jgi:tungstate transport system substrate-binding protein